MPTHCRAHCVQQRREGERCPVGKSPLNAVHEWQYFKLNYQTDVIFCSQCVWHNRENAPAVFGNCSPDHDSRRSSVSRPQTICFQTYLWPDSDQHMVIPGTKKEPAFIRKYNGSPLHPPNELWLSTTSVTNSSSLELVEYTLQGVWLKAILEVTDF
ncbi:uncharacterized protein TNCV_2109801 [Trichonephila clavipes]|nr:uncharacterized protein TNCV_2109801 [Trichonephila clavipes]